MRFTWRSEPSLIITGTEFQIRTRTFKDENGEDGISKTHWGREEGTCGWFFVPPKEKIRLEAEGAIFKEEGASPLQGLKDMGAGKYYDGINPLDYQAEARGRHDNDKD